MTTANLLIADHSAQGVQLGVTYDTGTLGLTAAWATNARGQNQRVFIAVGAAQATVTLPPGTTTQPLPGGMTLTQRTILPGVTPALALPVSVETRVPA